MEEKKLTKIFGFICPLTWGMGVYYTSNKCLLFFIILNRGDVCENMHECITSWVPVDFYGFYNITSYRRLIMDRLLSFNHAREFMEAFNYFIFCVRQIRSEFWLQVQLSWKLFYCNLRAKQLINLITLISTNC